MTKPDGIACPHRSILARLGTEDWDEAEQHSLEVHIETCPQCQAVLQDIASSSRLDISGLIAASSQLPEVAPDLPGFRIQGELGRGGGAVVYLAEDLSTSRNVAIKLIPGGWVQGSKFRARWMDEVRVAAQMQHHNIVRLYRVEETLHWFLLVFEYIPGGTLRDRCSQTIEPVHVAHLMQTIALAVQQIHQRGVLHLDLKPSNILLDNSAGNDWSQFVPKVSDFGIARWNQTSGNNSLADWNGQGTPSYMAPEQIMGAPEHLSPATDVYGLGGILYTMLTGAVPFAGSSPAEILNQVISSEVRSPLMLCPDAPAGLANIALRCLSKQPDQRYATPLDLAHALHDWIKQQDGLSVSRSAAQQIRKRQTIPMLLVGTVCCLAGILIWPSANRPTQTSEEQVGRNRAVDIVRDQGPRKYRQSGGPSAQLPEGQATESQPAARGPAARGTEKTQFDVADLIAELSEMPPAFDIERGNRLISSSRTHAQSLLTQNPAPVDQLLRFGLLMQNSAAHFIGSGRPELYPVATHLLEDSVQLLTCAVESDPDDQTALKELIASMFYRSAVRVGAGQHSAAGVAESVLQHTAFLQPIMPYVLRVTDGRQRVYWAGNVLDGYRTPYNNAMLSGNFDMASTIAAWEAVSWKQLEQHQTIPDLAIRHALMQDNFVADGWPAFPQDGWVLEENRDYLQNELVYTLLAVSFFKTAGNQPADLSAGDSNQNHTDRIWRPVLAESVRFIDQQNFPPTLLPQVIHRDLIRPLATFSTIYRVEGQLDRAEHLQRCYLGLCQSADRLFPDDCDVHLALSEAHLQAWKNWLRRDQDEQAIASLQQSLVHAKRALDASPASLRARAQVSDRIKRLTRLQTAAATQPVQSAAE